MKRVSLLFVLILTANVCYAQNEGNVPESENASYYDVLVRKTSEAGDKIAKLLSAPGEKLAEVIAQKKVTNDNFPTDTINAKENPLAQKLEQ